MIRPRHRVGDKVTMTEDAIDNYGEKWRGVELKIVSVATQHMPAKEFYARGMPDGYHPGFDASAGCALYDFDGAPMSLYEWEIT